MTKTNSIIYNIFKYSFSSLTSIILFLLFILAGRYLGVEDFGKFTFALAFVILFDPILDPGLYHLLIKQIARDKTATKQYLSHALSWKLLISPMVFFLIYLFVNLLHDSTETLHAVYLIAISLILKSFKDPFRSTLLAHECFGLDALSSFIGRLTLLVLGSYVLIAGKGLLGLCWTFVLVRLFDLLIAAAIVRISISRIGLKVSFSFLKSLVLSAIPIGAFYFTINIYNYVDTVMLSAIKGDVEVGLYNAGYKIYEGLLIFPGIIATVFMPRLSRLYVTDLCVFNELFYKGLKYIVIMAFFVCFNCIFFSNVFINFFFGIRYEESIVAFNILSLGILFVFCINFLQTVFIAIDKQKTMFYLSIVGLILNILLNLGLIPLYGYLGAALATIVVEFFIVVLLSLFIDRFGHKIRWLELLLKPTISLSISVSIFWFLFPWHLVYLRAFLVNLCFFALIICLRVFDKDELKSASKLLFGWRKIPVRR